ncbi:MAG: hypothetical protein QOC82_2323 [Frankiaceae bacterium]|jgi:hypothetical protein|nr:hypothetical protein [Frankiaceae bacterium]
MRAHRLVATAVGVVLTAGIVSGSPTASAGTSQIAHADIEISYNAYAFTVCALGVVAHGAPVAGEWRLDIDGLRSDGTPIRMHLIGTGAKFRPGCLAVSNYGAAHGAFTATLSFAGTDSASINTVPDVVAAAGAEASWNPITVNGFGT